MDSLAIYYNDIPVGRENAVTYSELKAKWGCSERQVRNILHKLSYWDNSDKFIIIRSSHGKGFYKTADIDEILRYKKEVTNRASHTFKALKKIRRVLKELEV